MAPNRNKKKKICHCTPDCNQWRSYRTRQRHYQNAPNPELIAPSDSGSSSSDSEDELEELSSAASPQHPSPSPGFVPDARNPRPSTPDNDPMDIDVVMDIDDAPESDSDSVLDLGAAGHPGHFNFLAPAEDEQFEIDGWRGFDEVLDADKPVCSREEMLLQLEEMVAPGRDAELWAVRNDILTDQDRDNIRAFHLKMISNMSREVFEQLRFAFNHKLSLSSEYVILHRVAVLSHVEPVWIHCCVNSCMAYTDDDDVELHACRFCKEPRFTPILHKPRRLFCYLPIIPRLQGYFQNRALVKQLLYRHEYEHKPETIADVFDSIHYRTLRKQSVVVDGETLPYKYFSGRYDIALGICLDSYLLFKRNRGGPSATPILLKNFNLPPEIQTHLSQSICSGIIPGPNGPKDTRSYLIPYDNELALLARGVPTFDALTEKEFMLRAYNIFQMGDIVAIEKLLNIKGHNGFCPCRSCNIKGVRNVTGGTTVYHVPLTHPMKDGEPKKSWDPFNLPLRTHESFAKVTEELARSETVTHRKALSKFYGIKGLPALRRVGSLHFGRSTPWDFMHLAFENIGPNLVKLWSGKYKGLGAGSEDYEIEEEVWDEIWAETAAATCDIPAQFVRVLSDTPGYFTAEAWCFWFMYLAPILLSGRFQDDKYYTHACQFSEIIKSCLAFQITYSEIDDLQASIIDWVQKYEEYYYQYREDRLSACPLTIHGLLHVPDDIRFCGPEWSTWTFWMERFCGYMQSGLRSRRHPWANLNNRVLKLAYFEQLSARYDLTDELSLHKKIDKTKLSMSEKMYEDYPDVILRAPYRAANVPDDITRKRVTAYLSAAIGKSRKRINPQLPQIMPRWGKMRTVGGDSIRSMSACGLEPEEQSERNMSFVRYALNVPQEDGLLKPQIFYGQLEEILVLQLPEGPFWSYMSGKTRLLAVITPCATLGEDASKKLTSYTDMTTTLVTDLRTIVAVVGKVKSRGKWYFVDRSGGLLHPAFTTE